MCLWTMGIEPLKIANGTISLRSGEGVASSFQVEDIAVAMAMAFLETGGVWGSIDKGAISLCSLKKDGA